MDKAQAVYFLEELLGAENVSATDGSEWVRASCPLAPWKHTKGTDERPSFGIRVPQEGEDSPPVYHCFACRSKGSLWQLVHTLTWLREDFPKEAVWFLSEHVPEGSSEDLPERRRRFIRRVPTIRLFSGQEVPEEVLRRYPPLTEAAMRSVAAREVLDYVLQERKILPWVVRDYNLRYYETEGGDRGIVFPVIDKAGRILDLYVRLMDTKRFFRLSPTLTGSNVPYKAETVCFGEHRVSPGQTLFLVEGAFDALRLVSLGETAVASLGNLSKAKAENFPSSSVILAFDSDEPGRKMAQDALEMLKPKSRLILYADWAFAGVKDPGELPDIEALAKVKGMLRIVYPTAKEMKKFLPKTKTFDRIRRKILEKRARLSIA